MEFVRKMLPRFNGTDILYVRSMRASKVAVMNVQCRSVIVAGLVRSTFASLVKQTPIPTFIGNVSLIRSFFLKCLIGFNESYLNPVHVGILVSYLGWVVIDFDCLSDIYLLLTHDWNTSSTVTHEVNF